MASADESLLGAAGAGDDARVIALLDAGADITRANEYGFDALGSALWSSHLATARLLVDRGAPVGLDAAAALGDIDALEAAWPESEPADDPPVEDMIVPFLWACRTGQVEVIRWFLARGVPVDLHPPGDEWGGIGCPGLHHTAENGHTDAVTVLLAAGADVTLVDDLYGSQALAWAAGRGHRAVCARLLRAGADPGHHNAHGRTAAGLARDFGHPDLAGLLDPSAWVVGPRASPLPDGSGRIRQ